MQNPERFGRWTVLQRVDKTDDVLISCDCGKARKWVTLDYLKLGKTKSCGCLRRELRTKYKNPFPVLRNMVVSRYKHQAKKQGWEWSLTEEEADSMLQGNCYYCGSGSSLLQAAKWTKVLFAYNSIERRQGNLGYTKENVVSCCKSCSRAKAGTDEGEFLSHLFKIAQHLQSKRTVNG